MPTEIQSIIDTINNQIPEREIGCPSMYDERALVSHIVKLERRNQELEDQLATALADYDRS